MNDYTKTAMGLTDEEIETLAKKSEYDAIGCAARGRDELHYEYGTVAAVLRDYVRLRKLNVELCKCLKATKEIVCDDCETENCETCTRNMMWKKVLEEAESGGEE